MVYLVRAKRRAMAPIVIMTVGVPLSFLLGLAGNAVSALGRWPGWLDLIRRHPVRSSGILLAATFALAAISLIVDRRGPELASAADVLDSEERLKAHVVETAHASRVDVDRFEQLPPYPRELIRACGDDQAAIWRVIKLFTDPAVDPYALAREWGASAPEQIEELPAVGRLTVAELLYAYGQTDAAIAHLRAAARMGVATRAFWLVRAALICCENSPETLALLDEAEAVDARYPLLIGLRHAHAQEWQATEDALAAWNPGSMWECDMYANLRALALARLDQLDQAIAVLGSSDSPMRTASGLIFLARLHLERSASGSGDSRWADALRAIETALAARNQRRAWRGDSAEAVVLAAEAALAADDHQHAWTITRPPPHGEATAEEAADGNVLVAAAFAGALTGRTDHARELLTETTDPYQRARIEAELASASGNMQSAIEAWGHVYRLSTTDDEKLQALERAAKEGFVDPEALNELRGRYPELAEAIELTHAIMSVTGPDADEKLRGWEARSPLASVRRADLARHDDPRKAAEILTDATARHQDPRLLRMAIDAYTEAGEWKLAEEMAEQVLSASGALWPGRAGIVRRLLLITWTLRDWPKVANTSRTLLEIDDHDDDARWALAIAQFHSGELEQAWHTLNRGSGVLRATMPGRAQYLLELARRFADAQLVARTALDAITTFPDSQEVHAAALNALTLGPDLSDLAEHTSAEITAAWNSFIERYPDSHYFSAFALREGANPFADIEAQMRDRARACEQALAIIREQVAPVGILARFSGKPYAASFLYRPLGYHFAGVSGQMDIDYELAVAHEARNRIVFIDASALYTLALIPDAAQALIALTHRPAIVDAAFTDLIVSDDHLNIPSNWSLDFDHMRDSIVVTEHPQEQLSRQRTLIRTMLNTARALRRVTHPALVHFPSDTPDRESPWFWTLDAAKDNGAILWSDDVGLRRLAHGEGIKAFGTLSLLALARERGIIDNAEAALINRTLISEFVVDLPFDLAALEAVAMGDNWVPGAVATVLSRPHTWAEHLGAAETILHRALRGAPGPHLSQWAFAAITGLAASLPANQTANATALVTRVLRERWSRPEHAKALGDAVGAFLPDQATSIMNSALHATWRELRRSHGQIDGAIVFRHLTSHLDAPQREHAAALIAASAS